MGRASRACPAGQPPAVPAELVWGVPSGSCLRSALLVRREKHRPAPCGSAEPSGEVAGLSPILPARSPPLPPPLPPTPSSHEPLEFDSNCLMKRERLIARSKGNLLITSRLDHLTVFTLHLLKKIHKCQRADSAPPVPVRCCPCPLLSLSAAGPELSSWLQPLGVVWTRPGRGNSLQTPPSSGCMISYKR